MEINVLMNFQKKFTIQIEFTKHFKIHKNYKRFNVLFQIKYSLILIFCVHEVYNITIKFFKYKNVDIGVLLLLVINKKINIIYQLGI